MPKLYLSYNMLSIYDECPQKYKFHYVDGLAKLYRQEKPYLSFGESLHKTLEEFFKIRDVSQRTKEALFETLKRVWAKKGYSSEEEEKQYFIDAERLLGIFYETQDIKAMPFRVEEFFRVPMKDFFLTGRIDRLDLVPAAADKLEIIDYKTGKFIPTQEEFDNDLQMSIYALGVVKKYPKYYPSKISVYYFQHGQKLTTERGPGLLRELEKTLAEKVAVISSDAEYAPRESPFCKSCDYLLICPLMGVCSATSSGKTRVEEQTEKRNQLDDELKKTKEHYTVMTQDLYALHNYSLDISSALDTKILGEKISSAFRGMSGAIASALFFWDESEGKFVVQNRARLDLPDDFYINEKKVFDFARACDYGISACDAYAGDNPFHDFLGPACLKNCVTVPLVTKEKVFGLMILGNIDGGRQPSNKHLKTILTSLADQAATAIYNASLYRYAIYDGLTKLFRGSHFQERLRQEMARVKRTKEALTLIMCDLDNFKKINDTYGHVEGDRILREFGHIIKAKTRTTDIAGRYGGEEFAVLLPATDTAGGALVAENIRKGLEASSKTVDGKPVTASFGVASRDDSMQTPADFVHRADEALYKAKQSGKNRVVSAD